MKTAQRFVLSCTALLVIAAIVSVALSPAIAPAAVNGHHPTGGGVNIGGAQTATGITSDGKTYAISDIDAVPVDTGKTAAHALPAVKTKETLLKLLRERGALYDNSGWERYHEGDAMRFASMDDGSDLARDSEPNPAPMPSAPAPGAGEAAADSETGGAHSSTNEQVAGVSEGDIVKTDGKYLYALSNNTLRIIDARGADMRLVSTIAFDDVWSAEFYLMGDYAAVVGQTYRAWDDIMPLPEGRAGDMWWGWGGRDGTVLLIYDVSDRANPVETRRVEMDGWRVSTRVVGDIVYLVTNKHVWAPYDSADSVVIRPCVVDTDASGELEPISLDRVFYLPDSDDASYLIVGAVDVRGGAFEPEAFLGAGNQVYMSRDNLYVTKTHWEQAESDNWDWSGRQMTDILRFAVSGTDIAYAGMGTVNGTPINQYSMDEYNGFFRIATTDWQVGTLVTVLDGNMGIAGQTGYLSPGEWMQSMRFMGDMGYVVTFEMVDPLFTVDLSDPYNPRVMGELKIPGFSQYLHPVGNGLLLGIGRDTQELYTRDADGVETVVGFRDVGMKLSLFDVSNPYDPLEIDVLRLGEGWAEVSGNPRALMTDPSRGLYGFTLETWNNVFTVERYNNHSAALLIRVENNRLSVAASLDVGQHFYTWNSRLCFIGDTLYLTHEQGVRAFDYNTFLPLGTLTF